MLRKEFALLLPMVGMAACTTIKADDHSYHHNDVVPTNTQHITYSTTVVRPPAPLPPPRPSVQDLDEEFLQYSQGSYQRQSSYIAPPPYRPVITSPVYLPPNRCIPSRPWPVVCYQQPTYRPVCHQPSYRPSYYGPAASVSYSTNKWKVQARLYP